MIYPLYLRVNFLDVMLGDVEVQKRAARDLVHEMNVLKSIGRDTHPNVLCLLGVCTDHGEKTLP